MDVGKAIADVEALRKVQYIFFLNLAFPNR